MKILITGGAGFIGYYLTIALLTIKTITLYNDYYDVKQKKTEVNY